MIPANATLAAVALAATGLLLPVISMAGERSSLPAGFAYVRLVEATIRQEIRYAGADNFTGKTLPGYGSGECILRAAAAEALKNVQADLASQRLGLKVFDCYRPKRAVTAMAEWAADGGTGAATKRYFPELDKAELHSLGSIAKKSAHSTGLAVDVTLVRLQVPPASVPRDAGPCTGPPAGRSSADEVDMGTGFDCFDPRSHTASPAVTAEQRRWRTVLVDAMRKRGFTNYAGEWWHFTYGGERQHEAYDFPVAAP
jgi:D-alanyl-D-alanine dipeptidase